MKTATIHFSNASAMCLYFYEMEGQISDGKYENSRPYDHWHWINEIKDAVIDGKSGISGYINRTISWKDGNFQKKYNLNEWFKYINAWRKKNDDFAIWATRIIAFGKFGVIYPNITWDDLHKIGTINIFLESLQLSIEQGEKNPEVLFNNITDFTTTYWRKDYYEECKEYLTIEFVKKFVELEYDIKECKNDVILMQEAINTRIKN